MFYSEGVLARKGPLARVWLAAHWERKLTKAQFLQTNIQDCVVAIIGGDQPPMALRLTGQLLLGVVKIYSRKTRYLMEDCNEAVDKIKTTFRPSDVDLREDQVTANLNAITLPDAVNELDILQPDLDLTLRPWDATLHPAASQNVSRPQDITLRESSTLLSFTSGDMLSMDFDVLGADDSRGVEFDLGFDFDGVPADVSPHRIQGNQSSPMEVEVGRDAVTEQPFTPGIGGSTQAAEKTFEDATVDGNGDPLMPTDEHEPPAFENVELELGITSEALDNEASAISFSRESLPLKDHPSPSADWENNIMFEVPDVVLDEVSFEEVAETPSGKKMIPRKRRLMIDENTQLSAALLKRYLADTSDITGKLTFLPFSRSNLRFASLTVDDYLDSQPRALAKELRSLFDPQPTNVPRAAKSLWRDSQEEADEAVVPVDGRADSVQAPEMAVHREGPMPEDFDDAGGHNDIVDFSYAADSADASVIEPLFEPVAEQTVAWQAENVSTSPVANREPVSSITPPVEGRNRLSFFDTGDLADEFQSGSALQQLESETTNGVFSATALKTMDFLRSQFATAAVTGGSACEPELRYKALSNGSRRSDAVRLFFEVLLLTTKNVISVSQEESYGDVIIHAKDELFGSQPGANEVAVR